MFQSVAIRVSQKRHLQNGPGPKRQPFRKVAKQKIIHNTKKHNEREISETIEREKSDRISLTVCVQFSMSSTLFSRIFFDILWIC